MPDHVSTRPQCAEPDAADLDPILLLIPALLKRTPDFRPDPPRNAERRVLYAMVRDGLEWVGYPRPAVEWAIHKHVEAGRLIALPRPPQFVPVVPCEDVEREFCLLEATAGLWAWFHTTEAAAGGPLAAL
ncbi:MAG: hypothetical protein K2V38_10290, partial [Gemmataceae bacterium]|nr:hypothetical protein [Gemmataceae bacterium]